ncbi:hypothetical protein NDU88_006907 [Pleurodeles waltl]|uniref:Uncharacterized protein n=1 Tax=Pleurodeles waltl TaxID=8319 RepID=A0AAV7VP51_PLEWA|nr:hypothetical protein NDU88_006907 [Pleurodeles waltl]
MEQKLKEEKEAKRAQLDGRHDYVLGIVAACLDLEKAEIEDAVLEGNQGRHEINKGFKSFLQAISCPR